MLQLAAVLVAMTSFSTAAAAPPELAVTFGSSTVSVRGIAPGATAVFFGIGVKRERYYDTQVRWQGTEAADIVGAATFDAKQPIPEWSVWGVVDQTTGLYAIATPGKQGVNALDLSAAAFRSLTQGHNDGFAWDHPFLDLLYVHPGHGAWVWTHVGIGTALNRDGTNRATSVGAGDAKSLAGDTGHFDDFAPGGVLIAIDWYRMEVAAVRLTGKMLGGGQ
jgi:hypothetical protein